MKSLIFKLAKIPFFGRFMVKWENPLSDSQRVEWESFSVKSKTGAILKGLWTPANRKPSLGTIILGHPMGKDAKGYFLKNGYGKLYQGCGLNVVVFDFNGFGESTFGNFSFFEDIIAIGNFAAGNFSGPIFYHGISLGGQWSTIAFTQNHPYDFAVLESVPTTLEEFWIKFPIPYRVLKLLYFFMPNYAKQIRMIDRISELQRIRSLLLIYSETDNYSPVSMGVRFRNNSNVPTELWTIPKADHGKIVKSPHGKEYEEKLKSFVTECLKKYIFSQTTTP